jgi:hypothetical protein
MSEREPDGVQRLAFELYRPQGLGPIRVAALADQRMAAQPGLNPYLVAPSGNQRNLDERGAAERFQHSIMAHRLLAARVARVRFLLDQRRFVPGQPIPPRSGRRPWAAIHDGLIDPLRQAAFELRLERGLRHRRPGEQHEARRVPVDAVDHERARLPARGEIVLEVCEHGTRLAAPLERYREHTGGLVQDDQRGVLVDNREIARVPERHAGPPGAARPIHPDSDFVAFDEAPGRGVARRFLTIQEDLAALERRRRTAARA